MTAPHFFAPAVVGDRVVLRGEEARHAVRVLRIRPGETITVSDGAGQVVEATVVESGRTLVAAVVGRRTVPRPRPAVTVFHAIPKHGKLDLVVQKLTELGVAGIQPFAASRSVARWDEAKARAQTERLAAIALQAAKQSRRAWLPEVAPPSALAAISLPEPTFLLHEGATDRIAAALPPEPPERLGLVVGPEGGLADGEVAALSGIGVRAVSLGPLILRTETAALVAAAVVLSRYGLLG